MMTDEELADLAVDIKANGQRQNIITTLLDEEEWLVDGRNRLKACEMVGIEPRFERVNGATDLLALVVSLNVKRRNLTAGQRAIAAAEAWIQAEKEGRVRTQGGDRKSSAKNLHLITKPRDHFAKLFSSNAVYVEQGHVLLKDDALAAAEVKAGASLKEKYDAFALRRGGTLNEQSRLRKLSEERPDLAEAVAAERITLEAAEATMKKEAEARKQQRWAFTMELLDCVRGLDRTPNDANDIVTEYDAAHAESRGESITPERLRKAADYLNALANAMESST
jgi:ParB-like chromosome segregation protein Spo0J